MLLPLAVRFAFKGKETPAAPVPVSAPAAASNPVRPSVADALLSPSKHTTAPVHVAPAISTPAEGPKSALWVCGYVRLGHKINVLLSDGRVLTERSPDLHRVDRNGALVGDQFLYLLPSVFPSSEPRAAAVIPPDEGMRSTKPGALSGEAAKGTGF